MRISGWGRYPWVEAQGFYFETERRLSDLLAGIKQGIVHAQGRSYGDSALNERVIFSSRYDKLLAFDPVGGILTCESGVTLSEIIESFLPRGWFLSVTPGTRFISVGGAIASDIHGKNHHKVGCFSECLQSFDLMLPDGEIVRCGRKENQELFRATCGGMGLTGIILTATFRLQRVRSGCVREKIVRCEHLDEVLCRFEECGDATYSVAWIDCLAGGSDRIRSVLMLGEHATAGKLDLPQRKPVSVPFSSPAFLLNRYFATLFNRYYFRSQPTCVDGRLTQIDSFFYPLDKILHWNRLYGSKGFTQYQVVLPKEASRDGLRTILKRVEAFGMESFLAVLKLLGPHNGNTLSFPMEGYTIALDFKIQRKLFPLLDELDQIVVDHGGRIYLAKDARMSMETFRKAYPGWEEFAEIRGKYRMKEKFNSFQSKRLGI